MDLWFMIKERYMLLSIFIFFIFVSLFLLLAAWKKRTEMPKSLLVIITIICTILIVLSIFTVVFAVSFGYNS
ncbi:CHASE2 domain-containing sensor protein [Sporosarcina sp. JAI121]|nr:CHASE2 domain-containing sensor protein [Sporosarcina sp. JAI121]